MSVENFVRQYFLSDLAQLQKRKIGIAHPTTLSDYEKTILYKYTLGYYESLNSALRANRITDVQQQFANYLNQVLGKLPAFQGVVFRGVTLSNTELQTYKDACENETCIQKLSFVSTSIDIKQAKNFMYIGEKTNKVIFEIISLNGKDITDFSDREEEKEVLFAAPSLFKVMSVDTTNEYIKIVLQEQI